MALGVQIQMGTSGPESGSGPAPPAQGAAVDPQAIPEQDIVDALAGYKREAQEARRGGPNARDQVWEDNWDLYWGRMDYSDKADWQSTEVMPEAPQYVDRWSAAMREALNQGGPWFEPVDPADPDSELTPHIRRFMDYLLARCGRTPDGHPTDFSSVFEDMMKIATIMQIGATVTWRNDSQTGGYVAVDVADPRRIWVDHTGRGLYRLRQYELDMHQLVAMGRLVDGQGQPLYNMQAIQNLQAQEAERLREERLRSSGHTQETPSGRRPVKIDEWLATVILPDGRVAAENSLIMVANDRHIIRGPEPNPFWHGRDWTVTAPLISVPLSVYGRSYMEDWSSVARSYIELTNLILDGTYTSTLRAFACVPENLEDPTQLNEGITPNKMLELQEGSDARHFMSSIDLGQLPPESVTVWQALKAEMREGAKLSEISLGQLPPKGDITATEVGAVQQSSSSLIRSMARTVEGRGLEPTLTLVWQTGLQHTDFQDAEVRQELGEETAYMLNVRRQEFRRRNIRFRVRGISALVDRQTKLKALLAALNTISTSPILLKEFLQMYSPRQLMDELMRLYGVDGETLKPSRQEQMVRDIVRQSEQAAQAVQNAQGSQGGAGGTGADGSGDGTTENPGQSRRAPTTENQTGG